MRIFLPWCIADALEDLAHDLSSTNTADKERAVSMLSSLTLYLEYHSAMMKAGVFPALIKAILDEKMVPQVNPYSLQHTRHSQWATAPQGRVSWAHPLYRRSECVL